MLRGYVVPGTRFGNASIASVSTGAVDGNILRYLESKTEILQQDSVDVSRDTMNEDKPLE